MDFHDSDRRARSFQTGNGYAKRGKVHGARPADGVCYTTGKAHDMKPQHISELIAELIATGKLPPEEKRARPARKPVRKVRKRKPVQMKLNLKA